MADKFDRYRDILKRFEEENRLRRIPTDRNTPDRFDLSSNDYLGLNSIMNDLQRQFLNHSDASLSSSASRLLASRQNHYLNLEKLLEKLYDRPALLFNSGYHANTGIISALNIEGTVFLCDKLIHASVIDGLAMGKADAARWRHNDTTHLRRLLQKYESISERMIVVAESIYSMDGDIAPIEELVKLKAEFPSMILYLDEAHAFGVRGETGLGIAEELGFINDVDILIATFGKAAASSGAFSITSPLLRSFLINSARSFIFSTAFPPLAAAWTSEIILRISEMKTEREHLAEISKDFRNFISEITGMENPSRSQIIPLPTGDAKKALEIANLLSHEGIDALAIRRPTVPPGGERIRFSLNASLSSEDMDKIKNSIKKIILQNENRFS